VGRTNNGRTDELADKVSCTNEKQETAAAAFALEEAVAIDKKEDKRKRPNVSTFRFAPTNY